MSRVRTIEVEQSEPPVKRVVLAEAILQISRAAQELSTSGLNEKAIVILLSAKTGLGRGICETVVHGLKELEREYLR